MVLLNRYIVFEGFLGISYSVVLTAYGLIALNGKAQKVIVHSLLWILIAISSSYMIYGTLGIITGRSLNTQMCIRDRTTADYILDLIEELKKVSL